MPSNTPNLGLYKKNPVTDGNDTFNIQTMLNENWDKIDLLGPQVAESTEALLEDKTATLPLVHGTQAVAVPRTTPARMKIPGRTLVNLFGKSGNGETIDKWSARSGTVTIDSGDKVKGNSSFKFVDNNTLDEHFFWLNYPSGITIEPATYYFVAGYIKLEDTNYQARLRFITYDSSSTLTSYFSDIATETSYVRVGLKFKSDETAAFIEARVQMYKNGVDYIYTGEGKSIHVDCLCIYKLPSEDTGLSVEQLHAKYPYVDSVQHLTGAYMANETNGSHLYVMDSLGEGEIFENGQKNKVWDKITLSENFSAIYISGGSGVGFKQVGISVPLSFNPETTKFTATKYDGKILQHRDGIPTTGDQVNFVSDGSRLDISIFSADSGWGDSYNPTSAEIAAYLMGWKMYLEGSGRQSSYNGTGTKGWISLYEFVYQGSSDTITSTVPTTKPPINRRLGDYEFHYKFATPVTVPVETEGSLMLSAGENQLTLGEGVVVREVAYPRTDGGGNYCINRNDYRNALKFRPTLNATIYKNNMVDNDNWIIGTMADGYWYNNVRIYSPPGKYDPSAIYTVTYLAEPYQISASALSAELIHDENLGTVVQDVVEKVSDIETDLSGCKTSQQRELAIVKLVMSGKNLLHNWDFRNPVNQRGQSSYNTNGHIMDRWKLDLNGGAGSVVINDGYITLSKTTSTSVALYHTVENAYLYSGETVTLSVMRKGSSNGSKMLIHAAGSIVPGSNVDIPASSGWITQSVTVEKLPTILPGQGLSVFIYAGLGAAGTTASTDYKAVKLELGPVATLANDPPADYGEQERKCQRYVLGVNPYVSYTNTRITSTEIDFLVPTPVSLRITPTIAELSGGFAIYNNAGVSQSGFAFTIAATSSNGIVIRATKASHGLTSAYLEYTNKSGTKIISAEL